MSSGVTYTMFANYFIYWLIAMFVFGAVGIIFLILMKKDYFMELPPFILPNTGNMGIPICLFAYGVSGMGIAAAISAVIVLLHFTLNIFLASKKFDVCFIVIKLFNLNRYAAGVLLIQSSMPSAILTYLIASMYSPKKVIDSIASTVVVSTSCSTTTVPITVFIALKYFA